MSLPHAILGFLTFGPITGYDLKIQCFDESVAHFWPADQAQIYRTLDKLADQGYVASHLEIQADRPNRKVYRITEAGRAELSRWLVAPQPLPVHREPFLIQLFFAAELPNSAIIGLLEQQLEAHAALLKRYQAIEIPGAPGRSRDSVLQTFTRDLGIKMEQAYIDWLNESIQMVRGMPDL